MATIIIPTPLRKFTNQQVRLTAEGKSVQEAINDLTTNYPDLKKNLLDEDGKLRTFVNVFIGDNNILDLQQESTPLHQDSIISIIPAIAGGN